ncbi:MAG: hypothetical protein AAF498_03275 [Pseudomonadota bacterium]
MLRFLSLLLVLAGLAVAAFGGYQLFAGGNPDAVQAAPPVSSLPPLPPPPESVEIPDTSVSEEAEPRRTASRSLSPATGPVGEALEDIVESTRIEAAEPNLSFSTSATREPDISQKLRQVDVAYEVPEDATFGRPFDVTFALDGTGSGDPESALPNQERIIENSAQVSDRARASLLGSAFDIVAQSPDTQIVSANLQNVWRWRVTPRQAGEHPLFIELYAVENGEALPVRTLNDVVTVNVSRVNQVIALANEANPIIVVLGGIGSMLAGILGIARFFRSGA